MLKKISDLYIGADKVTQVLLVFPLTFVVTVEIGIGALAGVGFLALFQEIFNIRISEFLSIILNFPFMVTPLLIDFFWDEIKAFFKKKHGKRQKRKKKSAEKSLFAHKEDIIRWYTSTFGITPHLDKYISLHERLSVIRSKKFYPYRKYAKFIKVSEDDKWVKIFNKYYPLDLIYGYDHISNELYFIDGYVVKLPKRAFKDKYNRFIDLFFDERGYTYDNLPSVSKESFDKIVADGINSFEKVDWASLRYKWEVAIAKEKDIRKARKSSATIYQPLTHGGKLRRDYYIRALSQEEIKRTADIFRSGNFSVNELTTFDSYVNEYCVCNGVKILGELGYPKNAKGIDFLFNCLKDVDEAYFMPAVDVLSEIPLSTLAPVIEEKAREAYKRCDVLRLAGILYLAKDLNYEIKFVKELKIKINAQKGPDMTSVDENGLVRFDPDQGAQLAQKEVVAFKRS
jgi:hypothetical protein